MQELGLLNPVDLRTIWPHEALYFTPWLAKNLSALGEVLGMDLELQGQEAAVGPFSLDLLARDLGSSRTVIIENQVEPTDHDHLGKCLTYAAGHDANVDRLLTIKSVFGPRIAALSTSSKQVPTPEGIASTREED
jgi:hypothetical protein